MLMVLAECGEYKTIFVVMIEIFVRYISELLLSNHSQLRLNYSTRLKGSIISKIFPLVYRLKGKQAGAELFQAQHSFS